MWRRERGRRRRRRGGGADLLCMFCQYCTCIPSLLKHEEDQWFTEHTHADFPHREMMWIKQMKNCSSQFIKVIDGVLLWCLTSSSSLIKLCLLVWHLWYKPVYNKYNLYVWCLVSKKQFKPNQLINCVTAEILKIQNILSIKPIKSWLRDSRGSWV